MNLYWSCIGKELNFGNKVEKKSSSWRRAGREGTASRRWGSHSSSGEGAAGAWKTLVMPFLPCCFARAMPLFSFMSCSCIQLSSSLCFKQPCLSPSLQCEVFFAICSEHMGTIFLLFCLLKRKGRDNAHRSLPRFSQNS